MKKLHHPKFEKNIDHHCFQLVNGTLGQLRGVIGWWMLLLLKLVQIVYLKKHYVLQTNGVKCEKCMLWKTTIKGYLLNISCLFGCTIADCGENQRSELWNLSHLKLRTARAWIHFRAPYKVIIRVQQLVLLFAC